MGSGLAVTVKLPVSKSVRTPPASSGYDAWGMPGPATFTTVPSCDESTRQMDAPFIPNSEVQPMLDWGVIAAAT